MIANPKPPKPIRDAAYRRSAQGRECMVEGCPVTETVVMAHIRTLNNAGMGMKPPDDESLWLCHHHHDQLDGRARSGMHYPGEAEDRYRWLVQNILIPQRKTAYQKWHAAEVARRAGR